MNRSLKILITLAFSLIFFRSNSQIITWEKCYGGSNWDEGNSIIKNKNGHLVTIGLASSNDGDVSSHIASDDFWICEIDTNGNLLKEKCFGLAWADRGLKIIETFDGGYLIGGVTDYPAGACHGQKDYRVYKIDSLWNLQWMKCFGSSRNDELTSIVQTSDSGFVICGHTFGDDGDIPYHYGNLMDADIFILKLRQNGNIEWSKILGGTSNDLSCDVKQSSGGDIYVTGTTGSFDFDLPTNRYGGFCVFKLDSIGNILRVKTYGSTNISDRAYQMILNDNDSYYVLGQTAGQDGDVTGFNGVLDGWLFKADSSGNLIWQKCLGTGGLEWGETMYKTHDGGLIVGLVSAAGDSIIQNYAIGPDCWIVKLDSNGNHEWNKIYGGNEDDEIGGIIQLSDHQYVFIASTRSIDHDVTNNHGTNFDKWVVNIGDPFVGVRENIKSESEITVKIIDSKLYIRLNSTNTGNERMLIYDLLGRAIFSQHVIVQQGANYYSVDAPEANGIYIISLGSYQKKFVN